MASGSDPVSCRSRPHGVGVARERPLWKGIPMVRPDGKVTGRGIVSLAGAERHLPNERIPAVALFL